MKKTQAEFSQPRFAHVDLERTQLCENRQGLMTLLCLLYAISSSFWPSLKQCHQPGSEEENSMHRHTCTRARCMRCCVLQQHEVLRCSLQSVPVCAPRSRAVCIHHGFGLWGCCESCDAVCRYIVVFLLLFGVVVAVLLAGCDWAGRWLLESRGCTSALRLVAFCFLRFCFCFAVLNFQLSAL